MRKLFGLGAVLALTLSAVAIGTASAGNNNPPSCGGGKMIVNVTYKLITDYDSGVAGNAWANDSITRHLQVFDVGTGHYCATVNDTGSFVTLVGVSPSGAGSVSAGITGVINGGYVTIAFAGTLDPSPAYATKGQLGTFDLLCTDAYTCPGAHPTFLSYFTGAPDWDYASWGWAYHTAQNGNWANLSDGNIGDITGS